MFGKKIFARDARKFYVGADYVDDVQNFFQLVIKCAVRLKKNFHVKKFFQRRCHVINKFPT